ncbi:hypothetical protein F2Q68_00017619, partial [Brassica cretica]
SFCSFSPTKRRKQRLCLFLQRVRSSVIESSWSSTSSHTLEALRSQSLIGPLVGHLGGDLQGSVRRLSQLPLPDKEPPKKRGRTKSSGSKKDTDEGEKPEGGVENSNVQEEDSEMTHPKENENLNVKDSFGEIEKADDMVSEEKDKTTGAEAIQ